MNHNYTHILILTKGDASGGASNFVLNFAQYLKGCGFNPLVVFGVESFGYSSLLRASNISYLQLPSLTNKFSLQSDLTSFNEIRILFKTYKNSCFILNSSKVGFLGRFAALFLRVKSVSLLSMAGGILIGDMIP